MAEIKYAYEGKIVAQPKTINQYQGQNKFGFKIEGDDAWYNFYQQKDVSDEEFKKAMEEDFKRGFKIQFNAVQGIVTDYNILDRTEEQKKSFGNYPREDPKQKVAGMIIAYVKDLIVADKIALANLETEAKRFLKLHQELSK